MTYYQCELCKFNTKIKSHIIRHHSTKKHIRNIINTNLFSCDGKYTKIEHKKSQKEPQKSQKEPKRAAKEPEYSCDHCFENFKTYANKRRHELHRCQKFKSIGNLCTDKDKIIDILYQKELSSMEHTACSLRTEFISPLPREFLPAFLPPEERPRGLRSSSREASVRKSASAALGPSASASSTSRAGAQHSFS